MASTTFSMSINKVPIVGARCILEKMVRTISLPLNPSHIPSQTTVQSACYSGLSDDIGCDLRICISC
jgi:hypothetical protein